MQQEQFQLLLHFFKVLANESRLKLLGLLAESERSVGELAALLELTEPTISHHLAKLVELSLVQMRAAGTTHYYAFNEAALPQLNKSLFSNSAQVAALADDIEMGDAWEQKVLRSFLDGQRLVKIPDTRKKRLVILKWLVGQFQYDVRYPERELNEIIKRHHPDTATLRRELIGTQLMQRAAGVYWRVPVETELPA